MNLKKPRRNCLNCGKECSRNSTKYCSQECQLEYQHKEYIKRWLNGEENGMKGKYQISAHVKRYLFEKYESKCCICSWGERNQYTNLVPLEVDHIDGNYKNNSPSNLQLICPNCHALTSTYKGANKSKGRADRLKYYYNNLIKP